MSTIDNTDDVIDSRDVIARIEELRDEIIMNHSLSDCVCCFYDWLALHSDDLLEDVGVLEYKKLVELASKCKGCGDWQYGETLIRESYFTQYIEELIGSCYELPKELESGNWPWSHITIDYEAAAEEAKQDYTTVDFDGVEYLIRS
jgi:hypothetical protein